MENMKKKYIACMILHAVGDTIGFKNSEWEFKFKKCTSEVTLEKLYEFIDLGGVNQISLKNWLVSDDTIMHMETARALLSEFNSVNTFGKILKDEFIKAYDQFKKEGIEKRWPGISILESIEKLKTGMEWNKIPYNYYSGGSGASMRSLCIGLAYHGENNRDKLMQIAIESGRITNNSAVGYLGGLASALFAALAVENKKINDWPFILLDLFDSGKVKKYIKESERELEEFDRDHHVFLEKWHRYVDDKFDNKRNPIIRKSNKNLKYRSEYYQNTFAFEEKTTKKGICEKSFFIGSGGDDSVIIAYDCLFDAGENWEKLVIYSMLHMGDTDTTGAIAGSLYGIMYGQTNVPNNFLEYLEYKTELIELGTKLFNKFYK